MNLADHAFANVLIQSNAYMEASLSGGAGTCFIRRLNLAKIRRPEHLDTLASGFARAIMQSNVAFDVIYALSAKSIHLAVATSLAIWQGYNFNRPFATANITTSLVPNNLIGEPLRHNKILILDDPSVDDYSVSDVCQHILQHDGTVAGIVSPVEGLRDPAVLRQIANDAELPVISVVRLEELRKLAGYLAA